MSESGPTEVPLRQIPTVKSTLSQRRALKPFHTASHPTYTHHNDEKASPKPAGRRRKEEAVNRASDGENETHLNEMGKIYEKILTYGTGTRYSICFDTSMEDIEALRIEMENFILDEENKRDFQPNILLRCLSVGGMDKLQLQLEVRHKASS